MAFKEIDPTMWKPEKDGDVLVGVFIRPESNVGENESMLYHFEVDDGKPISVWGSAILDQRMAWVKPGSKVRITYKGLGKKTGGKQAPKIFKVEIDDGK